MSSNNKTIKKAVFLGSKRFGISIFKALFNVSNDLNWSIIHPNDFEDSRSTFKEWEALSRELMIDFYVSQTKITTKKLVQDIAPDIGFVCGWYSLLDRDTLSAVKTGLWGIHNSLLPKYRGGAPLVWSIINGDSIVGSTVFKITEEMDAGDILLQVSVNNEINDTVGTLLNKIELALVSRLPHKWELLIEGIADLSVQDKNNATYSGQRIESDGCINWFMEANKLHDFIKAQSHPYPCAFTYYKDNKIRIIATQVINGIFYGTPGQILIRNSSSVVVACGNNTAIELLKISVCNTEYCPATYLKSLAIRLTNNISSDS